MWKPTRARFPKDSKEINSPKTLLTANGSFVPASFQLAFAGEPKCRSGMYQRSWFLLATALKSFPWQQERSQQQHAVLSGPAMLQLSVGQDAWSHFSCWLPPRILSSGASHHSTTVPLCWALTTNKAQHRDMWPWPLRPPNPVVTPVGHPAGHVHGGDAVVGLGGAYQAHCLLLTYTWQSQPPALCFPR